MIGGEASAAAAAAKALKASEKIIEGNDQDRSLIRDAARETKGLEVAGQAFADRMAARQLAINKLWRPLFWFSGYRSEYFENVFAEDMAKKLADVPDESLQTPAAIVAAQAMDGLGFSIDEPNLKEMYLSLLRTASDSRVASVAHPSFATIIKNLAGAESPLLLGVLGVHEGVPMAEIRHVNTAESHYITLFRHLLNFRVQGFGRANGNSRPDGNGGQLGPPRPSRDGLCKLPNRGSGL